MPVVIADISEMKMGSLATGIFPCKVMIETCLCSGGQIENDETTSFPRQFGLSLNARLHPRAARRFCQSKILLGR